MSKLVRLFPYNPRHGFVLQRYVLVQEGLKFEASRGWYEVPDEIAEKLAVVPQEERFPLALGGRHAFMVADDVTAAREMEGELNALLQYRSEEPVGTVEKPAPAIPAARPGTRTRARSRRSTVAASEDSDD